MRKVYDGGGGGKQIGGKRMSELVTTKVVVSQTLTAWANFWVAFNFEAVSNF